MLVKNNSTNILMHRTHLKMEEDYKVIDNIIYTPSRNELLDPRGIGWVYYECLLRNKDLVAQIDGVTCEEDTFSSLFLRCVRTAIALKSIGVQYGDVISVCTYNHLNSSVPQISSMFIGAKIAGLDPTLDRSEAVHLFKTVMPKVIFVGVESVEFVEDIISTVGCKTEIIVFGSTETYTSFVNFAKPSTDELNFQPTASKNIKDVAWIIFSSGTSGLPKGICHTHYSVLLDNTSVLLNGSMSRYIFFCSSSPYWSVFTLYLHYSILQGFARVVYPRIDLNNLWSIFTHKITAAFLNVTQLKRICSTPKPNNIDLSSLRLISTAGSPMSSDLIKKVRLCFPGVFVKINYGQTEVTQGLSDFDLSKPKHVELMKKKLNSCGLPTKDTTYKFVDLESGKALGPNQKGELRVKLEKQLSGYYNMESDDIWDEDGWLKTGDYGYYDEDCCLYIVDRVKEMFHYMDWHIQPAVIESILLTYPGVLRAVVIGIPHESDDNHAMAIIQLNEGEVISEADVLKFANEKLHDRQKLRGGVKFVDKLPLTPSKKVKRLKLKQMVLSGLI